MSVDRTLRLIAGAFMLLSLLLARFHHPNWLWFTAFIGLNLLQSGLTDRYPMMTFLRRPGLKREMRP
ncbi:MAG: DUF2892 domain-containing protein [Armatimonadetes bacterium]|nr:DUF2892 domain-containing protein [Armatimonadota bacterium]